LMHAAKRPRFNARRVPRAMRAELRRLHTLDSAAETERDPGRWLN
jgi:hypothetical protein